VETVSVGNTVGFTGIDHFLTTAGTTTTCNEVFVCVYVCVCMFVCVCIHIHIFIDHFLIAAVPLLPVTSVFVRVCRHICIYVDHFLTTAGTITTCNDVSVRVYVCFCVCLCACVCMHIFVDHFLIAAIPLLLKGVADSVSVVLSKFFYNSQDLDPTQFHRMRSTPT